jgi:glycine/D-amino acid oxidase-like deaminating enzyme
MSSETYDVVIVGGGIVGAACAYELTQRAMRVAVVEQDLVAGGATAAGMGHIVVMDDSDAQFALTRYSQKLWQELRPELPAEVEYEQCGTIWVAADQEEMSEVARKSTFYGSHNVPVEVLSASDLEQLEPNLRRGVAGGLLVLEDAVLYPPCAAQYLIERALEKGATLYSGTTAARIGRGEVQLSNSTTLSAATIVNATGAWASMLTPGIDVKKRKGHLVITDRYPGFVRHQLVELGYLKSAHSLTADSVAFNVQPRQTGQLLIGSSRQYGAEHKEVDKEILRRMMQRAQEYLPSIGETVAIRSWTGFRAATADKLPLIGPAPGDPSIYLATGHEGLGITTSLATGKLIAHQITGSSIPIAIEPYLPSRVMTPEHAHA